MQEIRRLLSQSGRSVALVWVTCVAIAVTSGAGLLRPPALLSAVPTAAIRVAGLVALVGAFAWMHRIGRRRPGRESSAIGPALLRAATLMAVLAVAAGLTPPPREVPEAEEADPQRSAETRQARPEEAGRVPAPPTTPPPARAETREGGTGEGAPPPLRQAPDMEISLGDGALFDPGPWLRRITNILFLLVLLAGVVLVAKRKPPARRGPRQFGLQEPNPFPAYRPPEPLEPFSLDGRNPREQVTFAYRHMLAELAEAGVARGREEAPYEYARRVAQRVEAVGRPLRDLTRLYVLAQYSALAIESRHGEQAAGLLRAASEILRRLTEDEISGQGVTGAQLAVSG